MIKTPLRILLAEDHTIVRQGLRALLSMQDDMEVVGEAEDGHTALALASSLQPDVMVMDIGLPLLNGIDATEQITQLYPQIAVLMLSMHSGEEYIRPALRAGARGFLLKGSDLSELTSAIRAVAAGQRFFAPQIAALIRHDQAAMPDEAAQRLSTRERQILQLVAEGYSSPQIAQRLHIAPKTVETHRARIMQKLHLHDLPALVRYAIRHGMISP